jgi:hypothetical protein
VLLPRSSIEELTVSITNECLVNHNDNGITDDYGPESYLELKCNGPHVFNYSNADFVGDEPKNPREGPLDKNGNSIFGYQVPSK